MRSHRMMFNMFIGMFVVQYVVSSYIMTNKVEHINHSVGKIYMCTIMGLFMVLLDLLIHGATIQYFSIALGVTLLVVYLYRIQFGVDDTNYLREMVEHHSMAILTSRNILEKTKNPALINLATKIVTTQEKEIDDMNYILKSI